MTDEAHLRLLRLLAERPDASQRQLAQALGISLGKTNYCVKALLQQGWIKVSNFKNSNNKLAYAYLLTPQGIEVPDIASVEILNPNIEPSDLTGKYIILDVLARDAAGHCYNVEVQVRRYGVWHKRGLFYLARTLGGQLSAGEDYQELRASVGLHLLDFDLFTATEGERQQAVWRFEMRDERQPSVSLGNILQMNLIELNKADRLGLSPGPLRAWITFFKHWQEELTMATVTHEPVKQAMNRIRELSADDEARRLAFVRERALHDEVSFLNEAKREGRNEGRKEGRHEGMGGMLRKQIAMKFGELPEWAEQHLASATDAQLEAWALQVLIANSLQEMLKH